MSAEAYYAVHTGRVPGIYGSWHDCEEQIRGFPKAKYKKFTTHAAALDFVKVGPPPKKRKDTSDLREPPKPKKRQMTREQLETMEQPIAPVLPNEQHVYTDGSCCNNGSTFSKPYGGIGIFFGLNDMRNIGEPLPVSNTPEQTTNQFAELYAIARALEICSLDHPRLAAAAKVATGCDKMLYVIHTDSLYSVHCIYKWYEAWDRNGFITKSGTRVKHAHVIQCIRKQIEYLEKTLGATVRFKHERGHTGVFGNEWADKLAEHGSNLALESINPTKLDNIDKTKTPTHVDDGNEETTTASAK